ncbi:MAG: hypothetical protein K0S33_2236 [Bacteroidetes bacterium]|jgi:hypothetical protein|nr:hypothetical protein [Bacteroidota bacterium]
MKKAFILLTISMLGALSSQLHAQAGVCGNFHKKNCHMEGSKDDNKAFMYNSQSKSGLFAQGTTSKLRCVIYKGMDYRMTVCCETSGSTVNFKIMDARTNEELFDNAKNENTQQFEFQSATTRQLVIEVMIPAGEASSAKGKPQDAACVGLLIEHKISDKVGFSKY